MAENDFVTRLEFKEYKERLEDQKGRWDRRLEILETKAEENHALTTSVAKLAQSMESMAKEQERQGKEQERQGERLDKIENRSGELLWKIVVYFLTAGAGFILAALLRRAGFF